MTDNVKEIFLPKVSVVVPIYNGETDLPDLISCLKAQTYAAKQVEYLLVDNKSCDRTPALLQAVVEESRQPVVEESRQPVVEESRPAEESRQDACSTITIQWLTEDKIQSSYAARNTGIRASTGEIIAFTDADCRPQPQWLEALIKPFFDPEVAIAVGEILPLPGKTLWEQHAAIEDTLSQKHTLAHSFYPYGQTANLAIRRQVLAQIGLFRPDLTSGGDADLCWRILRETSYKLEFVEGAIVRHRHRHTFKQLQSQWRRYGESNRFLHELHGVDLMREFTAGEYVYRLARWLLKEVPIASSKAIAGKATIADLLNTPIGLCNVWARSRGQQVAKLPEAARQIQQL